MTDTFLSVSSSEAFTSRDHFFFLIFKGFFPPQDFHELWPGMMSTCLINEVKQTMGYICTLMGDRLSALVVSLMGFAAHASRPKPLLGLFLCNENL